MARETIEYQGRAENIKGTEQRESRTHPSRGNPSINSSRLVTVLMIIPPLQGMFAESIAPFDRKPLTESVTL